MSVKEIFTQVFHDNLWITQESVSGLGSSEVNTQHIVRELPFLFQNYNIKTVLDIPCGDFYWFDKIEMNDVYYIGADIVPELVSKNIKKYPNKMFLEMDLLTDQLPTVDLIICRDCLFHFSKDNIMKALANIKRSNSKYLLTTSYSWKSFPNVGQDVWDICDQRIGWHRLNLMTPPYNFPPPLDFLIEGTKEFQSEDRALCLWRCEDIP